MSPHPSPAADSNRTSRLSRPPPPRRPLTERSTNAAHLDLMMPAWFPEAFQRLVDDRNLSRHPKTEKRLFARDLHEEAISEMIRQIEAGNKIMFLATPTRNHIRKKLWVDGELKVAVGHLAEEAGVSRASIVMTALQRYLEAHGALKAA